MAKKITSIEDLSPDLKNANAGTQRGRGMVEASLREVGAGRSILVDKDGRVIAGNKTLESAADIGLEIQTIQSDGSKLIVVQRTDLDLSDDAGPARRLAYFDNRASETGLAWDAEQLLASMNDGLSFDGLFAQDELDALLEGMVTPEPVQDPGADISKADELQKVWQVKLGDVWQLGKHRLACGDCTDKATVEWLMGGEKADMVFTDPPYNYASDSDNFAADVSKSMNDLKNSEWDKDFDLLPALKAIPLAKDVSVYVCSSHFLANVVWEWMKTWADHYSWCVWNKPNPMPSLAKRHWTWNAELIPYATRGKHTFNFPTDGHALCVWTFTKHKETEHPTEKPVEVPAHAIAHSSKKDAIIYDGFGGSGTTLIACEQLGRQARLIEISPAYCSVILQRYQDMTNTPPVRLA